MRSNAFVMSAVAAAYDRRTQRSSPNAAPGTSATPLCVTNFVQNSVPVIRPNESTQKKK